MGYVDNNLMAEGKVIYRTSLHWIVFIWPTIFFAVFFMRFFQPPSVSGIGSQELGLFLFPVALIWGILSFIKYKTSEFAVTDKRVMIKVGFIKRDTIETLLQKIEGIQVNQGILGRILNYGTIKVTGTGGTSSPFHQIKTPLEFRKKVQEQATTS